MCHPVLDEVFEKHVQGYLCSEPYDFLKEVSARSYAPEEQVIELTPV